MQRSAARRKVVWFHPSSPTSICTGWTLRRDSSHTGIHPRETQGIQPCLRQVEMAAGARAPAVTVPRHGSYAAAAEPAQLGPERSGLPAAALCPVRRRHPPRVHRTKGRSRGDQTRLATFLRDELKLELNEDKTLITHARTGAACFLGYEITVQHAPQDHRPARQRQRSRCACPGRDQGQMRPVPVARQTRAPDPAAELDDHTSSAPTGPSSGASSSTTCWPETSGG